MANDARVISRYSFGLGYDFFLDSNSANYSCKSISDRMINLNILGDNLFDYYVTSDRNVVGRHVDGKIYVRRSSEDLISSILHEGVHAIEYYNGIDYDPINSELRAYRAEYTFQKSSGRKTEFETDDDISVFVYRNYGRRI